MATGVDRPRRRHFGLLPWSTIVLLVAIVFGFFFNDRLSLFLSSNRSAQPKDSSIWWWRCSQIHHPFMEGCEHIWLDHRDRKLYGACTNATFPKDWNPGGAATTTWARSRRDHIAVLELDPAGRENEYRIQRLDIPDNLQKELNLHGFDARRVGNRLRFWLTNHTPVLDSTTGKALDVPTESSIEVFDLDPKSGKLVHVKCISSEALDSPNNLAVDQDGKGFLVINGGRTKLGPFRGGPFQFGSSSISYCRTDTGLCRTVASQGFDLANSIAMGHDGLAYISMSSTGTLAVYKMAENELTQIDALSLGSALDHLSVDAQGNILITAFTDPVELQEASTNPRASVTAGTVLMVQKKNGRSKKSDEEQYILQPMLEDEAAKLMSTTSTAVHDVQSDRIFLAGVFSPGISICEKRS
ncbi:uncharacterized protein N7458_012193 [Penicillium daleae]|uniref:SMP-30/Gluconolactonase/LRE-like region domain-containing protein n=1 Tax=Penicillium daleae TaxID=63821 RepID=A0AAD6FXK9_9EURO|nr:uncharacterized protein N7458_012193 [Penicillium daleae]KAJ5433037.1 hypothetical protein N7458_012193 [Penicillium daleae]